MAALFPALSVAVITIGAAGGTAKRSVTFEPSMVALPPVASTSVAPSTDPTRVKGWSIATGSAGAEKRTAGGVPSTTKRRVVVTRPSGRRSEVTVSTYEPSTRTGRRNRSCEPADATPATSWPSRRTSTEETSWTPLTVMSRCASAVGETTSPLRTPSTDGPPERRWKPSQPSATNTAARTSQPTRRIGRCGTCGRQPPRREPRRPPRSSLMRRSDAPWSPTQRIVGTIVDGVELDAARVGPRPRSARSRRSLGWER